LAAVNALGGVREGNAALRWSFLPISEWRLGAVRIDRNHPDTKLAAPSSALELLVQKPNCRTST
jgi:hypothetical protein